MKNIVIYLLANMCAICWMRKEKYYLLNITSFLILKIHALVWSFSQQSFFFIFKDIFETKCVKICVWQENGIEKYQAASITSLSIIIENVKCSNLVNRCEISSTEIEPQWLCIMSSFKVIILHTTIKLNINITIGTWAPPIIIFWEFYMNQHVIVTNPLEKTLSTLLLSLLVIPFIFISI